MVGILEFSLSIFRISKFETRTINLYKVKDLNGENMENISGNFPLIGEKAPSFEAQTTKGKIKFPEEFKGKWVVFFSHPADFTPVCTTEFVAFQKRYDDFKKLNCELIGLSIDQVFSHIKWVEWIKEKLNIEIKFPVVADDTGRIAGLLE